MSKSILILNGSPRMKGNTSMLCDAFMEGAQSVGHTVRRFDVQKMDIHGCLGCMKGGRDAASPCVQKDGMTEIYPAYREAAVVVLASPMYYWGISGQLKTVFDRLFAVAEGNPGYANPKKECALIMAARTGLLPCASRLSCMERSRTGAGRGRAGCRSRGRTPCLAGGFQLRRDAVKEEGRICGIQHRFPSRTPLPSFHGAGFFCGLRAPPLFLQQRG